MRRIKAALMASIMVASLGLPAQAAAGKTVVQFVSSSQPGLCPNWSGQVGNPGVTGVKWNRSGSRKIYLEWSLSPTNLEGIPVSRRFTSDEADQIRAAVSWWDSVFETIEFREVSGDYATIKIGAMQNMPVARTNYWYYQRSMTFARGQIAMPAASNEAVYFDGKSYNESEVRAALGYLLGLAANTEPTAAAQSRLRQIYRENSCYPVELTASWDTSNGLSRNNPIAAVGSAQRIKLGYNGISQIGASVLTPSVCRVANFSAPAQMGFLVNITGQGVCSILVQAREGSLPFSTEVLTLRTGFAQNIVGVGVPKFLKIGKSANLRTVTNSGLPVNLASSTGSICRVMGSKVIALKAGTCRIQAWTNEATFGQLRFLRSTAAFTIAVQR